MERHPDLIVEQGLEGQCRFPAVQASGMLANDFTKVGFDLPCIGEVGTHDVPSIGSYGWGAFAGEDVFDHWVLGVWRGWSWETAGVGVSGEMTKGGASVLVTPSSFP